jgi:EAL domain-containing protein (putative c-di-GMP-specific phosphodiesterase class I)
MVSDLPAARAALSALQDVGIKISLDDFGTGYSSMSYLKRFAVDTLKIDRSFVTGVATDTHNAAMVRAMITLAHDLNLTVVAEGIEDESELSFVEKLSCDFGQGFLFSKPVPAGVAQSLLFDGPRIVAHPMWLSGGRNHGVALNNR